MIKKIFLFLLFLFNVVTLVYAQNERVIITLEKDSLTSTEKKRVDSIINEIVKLDDVYYFRNISHNNNNHYIYKHLRCRAKGDSIYNVLLRSNCFKDVFFDSVSYAACTNPVQATNVLDTTYLQNIINLPCAWDIASNTSTLTVGIVDNLFYQHAHEDVIGKSNQMYGPYLGDKRSTFNIITPGNHAQAHGLMMAGIIAGNANNSIGISGITNQGLFNGYLLSDTGDEIFPHISEIQNAISYASFEQEERILNISYSDLCLSEYSFVDNEYDSIFYKSIIDNETVIVTSAGNSRYDYKKEQIYDIPGVIVVGAINRENKILLDAPTYACNPYVEICAPGIGITTTHWEDGESSYINGNGTSASAAIVSGVIGLMLSTDNSLTPAEIEYILKTSADSITDYAAANTFVSNYYNGSFIAGSLNAYHAVYKAKHYNDCMSNLIEDSENVSLMIDGFISDTLIVEGRLSVYAPLHILHNLPHIIVRNGGQLIFEDGGELFHWEDEIFNGDIIIEAGSTLEFKNGSDIVLAENGKIIVNHDSNNSGELVFNNGTSLTLLDDNTYLEISGDLYIASNSTFTFTGDGYIKFSNPGGDATNNIFCGSGASIVLQGSGQNDKIMEVQQSTVRFPAELSSFELRDGKIEMGANARLLNEVVLGNEDYPITLDNIKITSDNGTNNNHRSYVFWGQPNITVNDCVFEYGQYGLYNYTYWGSPLTVTNSTFRDNQTGLYMYDKGLTLTNCIFDDNTQVGLHADNMSFVSGLSNCKFNNNQLAVDYQGSANADFTLNYCEIGHSITNGVSTSGGFDLNVICTYINDNGQNGIYTNQGTRVCMDYNQTGNKLTDNNNAIHLDYGSLIANSGYNDFTSDNLAVIGESPHRCIPGLSPNVYAQHNTWDSGNNPPTFTLNHTLEVLNCYNTPVNLIDMYHVGDVCPHKVARSSGTDMQSSSNSDDGNILLSGESTNESLSAQIDNLELSMQEANTATVCQQLLSESITLMENVYGIETAETYYQSNRIWSNIHNIIDKHYEIIGRDNENLSFNQSVDQVMQLNEQLMLDADAIAYYEYALDNALLERLRGNFDESLLLLDNLIPELEGMDKETAYVNRWICHVEAEREAALRNITPEEFMDAVAICNTDYENALESLSDNLEPDESAEETSTAPEIHIVPNPNNGNFTLEISECTEGSSVRISNVYSQPVFTQTFTESGTQTVQITGLSQGHYTVYYLENNIVISSESIVVE